MFAKKRSSSSANLFSSDFGDGGVLVFEVDAVFSVEVFMADILVG